MAKHGDLTYHGYLVPTDEHVKEPYRIAVEVTRFGSYGHEPEVLKRIPRPHSGGFNWGYDGGDPFRAAEAVLVDAFGRALDDEVGRALVSAFSADFMSQQCSEWRIRRGMVLRWARGWCAETGNDLPVAASGNTPAELFDDE